MVTGGMTIIEQNTMESIQSINQKMPEVTLRDLFAMNALNGILAQGNFYGSEQQYAKYAKEAYCFADAMIKARKDK